MKYREISKLQTGGGVFFSAVANPFSSAAQQDMQSSGSSSGSGSGSGEKILSDSMMNKLMEEALPNDFRKFMAMVADFENEQQMGLGVDRRKLYDIRAYANQIVQQKKFLKSAEDEAVKNGAWDEFAVDSRGFLYVMDESGRISRVAPSKFNSDKYQALTVGELIQQRKENDALIDHSDVATTIGNNIGIEKINDYILDIVKKVGSSETASEAYTDLATIVGQANAKKPNMAQLQAIQGIANQLDKLGGDAIFKNKELMESPKIQEAFGYILSVLPQNMKNQLMGRYVANGGKYEDASKHAQSIILSALQTGTDNKYHYGIDYAQDINTAAGTGASATKPKQHDLTMMELFFNQDLNHTQIQLSDSDYDNKTALVVPATIIPSLVTDNNNPVTNRPLSLALADKGMGKYLDYSKIFMGYQPVSEGMLQNIAYTNGKVANVWLPVDQNDNIDFRTLHNFSQAVEEIQSKGITDIAEKNKILRQHGVYATYDPDGKIRPSANMKQFLFTHGYTTDDHVDSKNTFVKELKGNVEDEIDNVINSIYKGAGKTSGVSKIQGKQRHDDIIEVPIFIKIDDNAATNAATFAGYGSLVDTQTLEQMMMHQEQQAGTGFTASGSELYQE